MTTVWRMDPVARLRRGAVAVREQGQFRLASSEVEVPVAGIADWLEASAAALE
ncbi:hypothetical protein [Umezawaea sp. Da 62-37]|uniref:hypothetical protein n=1 Tax=Umezawaea sp. Da 62-37 TaxID=3075927 RepID=UPI0028F704B6|nr:hypothetical protein [Umezawaea sp. Da 62-37]WNV84900.1 hypothetical protein RM788_43195 [Umezawaea sp. Da 62-37]